MPQSEMISIAESMGINIVRIGEFIEDGLTVSSTKIRRLLRAGNVVTARNFLGYPYCLCGIVVKGNGIGRTMGFPTANMQLSYPLKLVPGDGVYAVRVYVNNLDVPYRGICNIGKRPTISNNSAVTIETNILDYDEDIYGLDLKIEFISRMRNEIKFPSLNELTLQLQRDRKCARNIIEL
jgi:riboflavin kinase/FMN adenylyltransferase